MKPRIKAKTIFLATLVTTFAVILTDCDDNDNDKLVAASEISLSINGEHYDISLPATETVNLTTLCTEFDAEVIVENSTAFQRITIDGKAVEKSSCSLPISRIDRDTQIEIAYTTGREQGRVLINTLHADIPEMKTTGQAKAPGDFYLSFVWKRLIMKYDNDGRILFYRYEPHTVANSNDDSGWWDFKKHTSDNGKTYYSYHANDPAFADRLFAGYDPGMRIILDDHYNPIKTIHLLASRDGTVIEGEPLDGHDFYFFSPNHYIVSAYLNRTLKDRTVAASYLQEVQDGKVVFDWWSTEHPELEQWANPTFDTSFDYVHFNSIQVLPDGNWLCSFRHLCTLLKINRADSTGNILWAIHGADLDEKYRFYGQHYATLIDNGTLILFDNGNGHTPQATRLLCLKINPVTGDVTGGGNILPESDNSYYSKACGSFAKVGDYYVAGWGHPGLEQGPHDRLVTEYDDAGREIFGIRQTGNYQQNAVGGSYRCVKYK